MRALQITVEVVDHIPWTALAIGHSLAVAGSFKGGHGPAYLFNYLVGILSGYGGGVLTCLLIMEPKVASMALLSSNQIGIIYTLSWWAMNYFPLDLVARLHRLPPVTATTGAARGVLRAGLIAQRVDVAVKVFPGVIAAPLVLGTLAGSGGSLLVDAFNILGGYCKGPSQLAQPGYPLRSGFLATLAYYLLVHVAGVLTRAEGRGLVISVFVAYDLAAGLTGLPMDYTAPFGKLFHTVTLIPEPGKQERGRTAARATKSSPPRTPSPPALHRSGTETALQDVPPSSTRRRSTRRRTAAGKQ